MLPSEIIFKEVWYDHLLDDYLDENIDLFQCASNSLLQSVLGDYHGLGNRTNSRPLFNFAYGLNVKVGKVNNSGFLKFNLVVSPSDHIQLSDTTLWMFRIMFLIFS